VGECWVCVIFFKQLVGYVILASYATMGSQGRLAAIPTTPSTPVLSFVIVLSKDATRKGLSSIGHY